MTARYIIYGGETREGGQPHKAPFHAIALLHCGTLMHPFPEGGTEIEYRQIDCYHNEDDHLGDQNYQYRGYQRGDSGEDGEWSVVSSQQSVAHAG